MGCIDMPDPFASIEHRPYPLPDGPWAMRQTWHELIFAHWPVDPDVLRPRIPPGLALDVIDGQAWVGIVPFRMSNVRPRFTPAMPWISAFPELNVRTYVTADNKPGVWFFSLDAGNMLAVWAARKTFFLPYFHAKMSVECLEDGKTVRYRSQRVHRGAPGASLRATYRPVGEPFQPQPGTLEWRLTERYCLYCENKGRVYRAEIQHPPWRLQAAEWEADENTMAAAHGILLPDIPPLVHYADRQDMVAWLLERVSGGQQRRTGRHGAGV